MSQGSAACLPGHRPGRHGFISHAGEVSDRPAGTVCGHAQSEPSSSGAALGFARPHRPGGERGHLHAHSLDGKCGDGDAAPHRTGPGYGLGVDLVERVAAGRSLPPSAPRPLPRRRQTAARSRPARSGTGTRRWFVERCKSASSELDLHDIDVFGGCSCTSASPSPPRSRSGLDAGQGLPRPVNDLRHGGCPGCCPVTRPVTKSWRRRSRSSTWRSELEGCPNGRSRPLQAEDAGQVA